jgi:serine/threonine protein kinase
LEQHMGQNVSYPTDLYSLGIVMYRCLSGGRFPHGNNSPNAQAILVELVMSTFLPPIDNVSSELFAIVTKALQKQVADRYSTATQMLTALQNIQVRPQRKPYVFLSYRRSHSGSARSFKMELETLGYKVFFDLDRESGLGIGPFQTQLEVVLEQVDIVIVMVTAAPSGPQNKKHEDGGRFDMSSTETMKEYARLGWTDYCAVEVEKALASNKIVIPIYYAKHGTDFIGDQLRHLADLPSLKRLRSLNAYDISDSIFSASVKVVHDHIQREIERRRTVGINEDELFAREELELSGDAGQCETKEDVVEDISSSVRNCVR